MSDAKMPKTWPDYSLLKETDESYMRLVLDWNEKQFDELRIAFQGHTTATSRLVVLLFTILPAITYVLTNTEDLSVTLIFSCLSLATLTWSSVFVIRNLFGFERKSKSFHPQDIYMKTYIQGIESHQQAKRLMYSMIRAQYWANKHNIEVNNKRYRNIEKATIRAIASVIFLAIAYIDFIEFPSLIYRLIQ